MSLTTTLQLPDDLQGQFKIESDALHLPEAHSLEIKLQKNINDLQSWTDLFNCYDIWLSNRSKTEQGKDLKDLISVDQKRRISNTYQAATSRFINWEECWKRWLATEFKLNGTDASIEVLQKAVETFPTSIVLWTDYLAAIKSGIANSTIDTTANTTTSTTMTSNSTSASNTTTINTTTTSTPAITTQSDDVNRFRFLYKEALKYNGYNFNSSSLWDISIEFESSLLQNSDELRDLYLQVLSIPLYQYAHYYTQFSEISKNFDIHNLLPESALLDYIEKFGKARVEDLSLLEKHQIIDDYFAIVFTSTQAKVTAAWEYEQNLLHQEFSHKRAEIDEEKDKVWFPYIEKEITDYRASSTIEQYKLVVNLFERALIPNCFDVNLWSKYISFVASTSSTSSTSLPSSNSPLISGSSSLNVLENFHTQQRIYTRANSRFVPLDQNELRLEYVQFLLLNDKPNLANEFLFDWMKIFSGNSRVYHKSSYLLMCQQILNLWEKLITPFKYKKILETLVELFFKLQHKLNQKNVDDEKVGDPEQVKNIDPQFDLKQDHVLLLAKFLNDDSIAM
ncbi:hypothetical protein PP707_06345, partial [Acetobacter pasteurianus]|nr:hypothetical protein [Acetobacter pasteurianus]